MIEEMGQILVAQLQQVVRRPYRVYFCGPDHDGNCRLYVSSSPRFNRYDDPDEHDTCVLNLQLEKLELFSFTNCRVTLFEWADPELLPRLLAAVRWEVLANWKARHHFVGGHEG